MNLGKFNSVRAEVGVEEEIFREEDKERVFERLWNEVKTQVQIQLNKEMKYE
jgi:hypothetical protein